MELWRMQDLRHTYSPRLSGGQRRLLRLAVAMVGSPSVLILDEPTNDLDPQRRKLVWDLPIQKHTPILAVILSFLLLSLPSLVVTVLLGSLLLGVPIAPNPVILVVVPLCAIPMAGIGALIGNSARTPQQAGSISFLVTFLMFGLGPVVIPPERLPDVMLFVGRFSPATYAASALRQALLGPLTGQIALDLSVLATFTMVVFWLVGRKMDWRQG